MHRPRRLLLLRSDRTSSFFPSRLHRLHRQALLRQRNTDTRTMSTTTTYKSWVLNEYVKGELNKNNFRLVEQPLPKDIPTNHVLIRTLYVGFEPAMRPSISLGKSYREPHPLNTPMWAFGIGVVAESKSSRYKRGQKVVGMLDWSEYTVLPEKEVWPYDSDVGLQHLSALSAPGVAAHVGLVAVANVKKGDVVLVSAAAGATGSVAIQVAKAVGASRVIGIASKNKCQSVLDNGADACVDYTSPNFESDLRKATNRKVNVYFDNVGGKILDAALPCMAMFGRVALCGMIAEYNKIGADAAEKFGIKNLIVAVSQSLTLRGYVVIKGLTPDDDLRRANRELTQWIKEGKIKASIYDFPQPGIEHCPDALKGLLVGQNTGKMTLRIAKDAREVLAASSSKL